MADPTEVTNFCSVAGATSPVARQYLEMAGGDLANALRLFMDLGGTSAGAPAAKRGREAGPEDGDTVRPPDETKRQRLLGGVELPGLRRRSRSARAFAPEPFADFRGRQGGADQAGGTERPGGLHEMYAPPTALLFAGDFAAARKLAQRRRRWLLVNIQDPERFDSHRLNRDVFGDESVRCILDHGYVLWQRTAGLPEGALFLERYRSQVGAELPLLCLIDPRTGGVKWHRSGFVEADRIIGFLSDFNADADLGEPLPLDADEAADAAAVDLKPVAPSKGAARDEDVVELADDVVDLTGGARLPASAPSSGSIVDVTNFRGPAAASRVRPRAAAAPGAAAAAAATTEAVGSATSAAKPLAEPASSAPAGGAEDGGAEDGSAGPPAPKRLKIMKAKADVPAAAGIHHVCQRFTRDRASLEPEPPAGPGTGATRVQLRLPDGRKLARRFLAKQSLGDVFRFAASVLAEDAARAINGAGVEESKGDDGIAVPSFDLRIVRPPASLAEMIEAHQAEQDSAAVIVVDLAGMEGPTLRDAKLLNASCLLHLLDA